MRPSIAFVVVALLLILLPVVAVFQYRWLGKVSEAERERLERTLRSSARDLGDDFDRELARAFVALGVEASENGDTDLSRFGQQFDGWSSSAPHPNLISEVFFVHFGGASGPELRKYDRGSRAFVPVAWDTRFDRLRSDVLPAKLDSVLVRRLPNANADGGSHVATVNRIGPQTPPLNFTPRRGPIDASLPALVIPVGAFAHQELPAEPPNEGLSTALFVRRLPEPDVVVAMLDTAVIANEILPGLVARHFGAEAGRDIDIGVIAGSETPTVNFSTDPALDAGAYSTGEIVEPFLTLSPESIASVAAVRMPPQSGRGGIVRGASSRLEVKVVQSSSPAEGGDRIFLLSSDDDWKVAVRHHAGSLDAAVETARLRNLALSFGILVVLCGSVVMLVVSSQRAQRLARRQMEFVAGVSHELRTPLAVICSAAENLTHGVVASERQVKQYGALIEGEGRRLAEMVEQVLEYAGAESGKTRYTVRPVDISELVDSAIRASEPLAVEAGIEFRVALAERLPIVEGDPNALRRALQNLVANAIKYGASGGVVEVSAASSREGDSRFVTLAVADRGPGIDAADIPHLFEPFYRGRLALDAQIHGSGLGLNLVKRVAEAHGGSVRVQSTLGAGSTFTLRLPAVASATQEESVAGRSYEQAHPTG